MKGINIIRRRYYRIYQREFVLWENIIVLIFGLFFGTMCTFGNYYYEGYVDASQTEPVEVIYKAYEQLGSLHATSFGTNIYCYDSEKQFIDGHNEIAVDWRKLNDLKPGTTLQLLLHPRSHNILSMKANDNIIMDFEKSQQYPFWSKVGLLLLGIMMYLFAFYSAIELLVKIISYVKMRE